MKKKFDFSERQLAMFDVLTKIASMFLIGTILIVLIDGIN